MTDNNRYEQLIAKCWADESFKQKLMSDPAATLKSEGIDLPEGIQVEVHENTAQHLCLVIPQPPSDLSDDQLDNLAGGMPCGKCNCYNCG